MSTYRIERALRAYDAHARQTNLLQEMEDKCRSNQITKHHHSMFDRAIKHEKLCQCEDHGGVDGPHSGVAVMMYAPGTEEYHDWMSITNRPWKNTRYGILLYEHHVENQTTVILSPDDIGEGLRADIAMLEPPRFPWVLKGAANEHHLAELLGDGFELKGRVQEVIEFT
ncbi:hypothetical protein BJ508DRAFT_315742 [Ascobolus immersus RN42]|uniref:Uncharacterized protein n=1 Tax=Ascobolus immersus RN42 TaxID=1160509 RepID=A0A3N4HFW1_ASCIM|nr:hypothetical protein BJ508DRAFT_315742 [Ascobolus immersus RN42]